MKKLIPLMMAMALMFGAVTAFADPQPTKATKAKATKAKAATKAKS